MKHIDGYNWKFDRVNSKGEVVWKHFTEQPLEEVLSFFNQIMKNMNKLSIEGLYYLIKLITILINQNHVCDNSKKHNYHNTYISTLDYIYNKIQKTKKRIKSEEFQFSYLNNIPINKAIIEEWEKVK